MKLIDSFLFFNELDLLELRLKYLDDVVDYFVITEARISFNGQKKALFYNNNKDRFKNFHHKIIHIIVENIPNNFEHFKKPDSRYTDYHRSYPHKHNGKKLISLDKQFQREVYLKDYQIIGLNKIANNNDIIILGDLDEIPNKKILKKIIQENSLKINEHYTLCLKWYMYYFNVKIFKDWFGIRICRFSYLSDKSIDLLRYPLEERNKQNSKIIDNGGWHFSFFGGEKVVREKLYASNFQARRFNFFLRILNLIFKNRIKHKIDKNLDVLEMGRKFEKINYENEFPKELLDNIKNYKYMFK